MIREKQQKSGSLLEVDFYPIWQNGRRVPSRAPKTTISTQEQLKYNRNQATKKLIRLVNVNFSPNDYYLHPTYEENKDPKNENQARKDMNNFIRRLKRYISSKIDENKAEISAVLKELEKYPDSEIVKAEHKRLKKRKKALKKPFKYIYCIEKANKWHFHMFLSGCGLSKDEISIIWGKGILKGDKYNPDEFGPEAAAAYMAKNPKGRKSFVYSRNLQKPKEPRVKDGKITRSTLARMAQSCVDDSNYWENKYKGYRFMRSYPRFNKFNNHWYMSVILYKSTSPPPKWQFSADEWLTDDFEGVNYETYST